MFSPDRFLLREKIHVCKIYHGHSCRDGVAGDGCVSPNSDNNHRPRQHGIRQHGNDALGFLAAGRLARLESRRLAVYNDNNDSVGTINDLLMDKSGNIKAVVLGVGGFLGVGEYLVAVPFDKVKFVDTRVPATAATSSNSPSSPTTTGSTSTSTSAATSKSNPWYPDHAVFNATKDELKAMPVQIFVLRQG
jgi:sporulation protein YlmC with PRC-barrel domain